MEVLIYLVPVALVLGLLGLGAFLWSLKTGQYDDLEGAAWRAIMDDDTPVDASGAAPDRCEARSAAGYPHGAVSGSIFN
jgi:cbb3-type cytochrome oxidase maturation protein